MADKPEVLDPEAPPSDEEVAEANRLRDALASGAGGDESAELARALSAAWSPRDLSPADHRALVARSLAHARRRRRVLASRASFGAGALIALAAGALVVLRGALGPPQSAPVGQVAQVGSTALISSRSTQSLFAEPFAGAGGQTSRVDRIAMARAADLRENEFARWGIR
jgi:hypothetical protein